MARIITLTPNPVRDYAVDADFVEANRKIRCKNPQTHPGGGGVNVARAAHRLGVETLAIMTAGGVAGSALIEALTDEGVASKPLRVAGETRIAFHVRDIGGENEYRFNLPGEPMSASEIDTFFKAAEEEIAPGDFVVGSGSLPPNTPEDFWARAARLAKKKEARFVLDSVSGLGPAISEGFSLLRMNQFEYPVIAGESKPFPDGVIAFAKNFVKASKVERMSITHGGEGSIMTDGKNVVRVEAIPIAAHSAVGAGDSYVAGLLAAWLRGWDDDKALHYAMCAAAATRLSPGTALFRRDDVERLFSENTP